VGDPAEIVIATQRGGSLAKVSAGIVREDGEIEEIALFQIKRDERYRHDPMNWSGELTVHARDARLPGDGLVHIATLRHDEQWFKNLVAQPTPGLSQDQDWFNRHPGQNPWEGADPNVPPVVAGADYPPGTVGIPIGDFAALEAFYGFESEDRQHYADGDIPWVAPNTPGTFSVVWEMEKRKASDAD
jgi:hypothetical protein